MGLIKTIREAWGWCGLEPSEITHQNSFGNLIVRDEQMSYWRICPEELSARKIAQDESDFQLLFQSPDFAEDWAMIPMVRDTTAVFGQLSEGRVFCLQIPAVLGGKYEADNYGTISLIELISFSGDVAHQIKDVPEGAKIQIKLTE